MKNFKFISILKTLQHLDDVYIVGGTVRDMLIGKDPFDIDIVVSRNAESLAKELSKKIDGTLFLLDKERGVFRINRKGVFPPFCYDISPMKGGDIQSDLSFRDFTIDALAIKLPDINASLALSEAKNIIDPYNGRDDIEKRCIRVISAKSFEDDPLRMLRAFRLAGTLEFEIEADTLNAIRDKSSSLRLSAPERIRDEFFRLISCQESIKHIKKMNETGLLIEVLTGLREEYISKGLSLYERIEQLYNNLQTLFSPDNAAIEEYLQVKVEEGVTKAALWKWMSFYIINDITEELMIDALKGLRLGNRAYRLALLGFKNRNTEILNAVLAFFASHSACIGEPKPRAERGGSENNSGDASEAKKDIGDKKFLYHLFKKTGDDGIGLILAALALFSLRSMQALCEAKNELASAKEKGESTVLALSEAKNFISWYIYEYKKMKGSPLITGKDLIEIFHLSPDPSFSRILDAVEEKRAIGSIATREDALSFIKTLLTNI